MFSTVDFYFRGDKIIENRFHKKRTVFSRVHAAQHHALSVRPSFGLLVCRSVSRSVRMSVTILIFCQSDFL